VRLHGVRRSAAWGIEPSVLTLRFIFLHRSIKSSNTPIARH
jgi:hypothetical protein